MAIKQQFLKDSLLIQKLFLFDAEFHFIFNNETVINQYNQPIQYPLDYSPVINAWIVITASGKNRQTRVSEAWAVIDEYGEKISDLKFLAHQFLRRLRMDGSGKCFFVLVDSSGRLPEFELNFLINILQIEQGFIPIHASGVIYRQGLFLFGGKSGSGKSTIASLSCQNGSEILDEDQVMIYRKPDGTYSANAWGYSLKACSAPIRAYFRIVKDRADRLVPLTQTHTAKLLMEQSCAVTGNMLPEKSLTDLFKRMAELACAIPGYELRFRKSPDFWELIENEFHNRE